MRIKKSINNLTFTACLGLFSTYSVQAFEPLAALAGGGVVAFGAVAGVCVTSCFKYCSSENSNEDVELPVSNLSRLKAKSLAGSGDKVMRLVILQIQDPDAYDKKIRKMSIEEIQGLQHYCKTVGRPLLPIPEDIKY